MIYYIYICICTYINIHEYVYTYTHILSLVFDLLVYTKNEQNIMVFITICQQDGLKCDLYLHIPKPHIANLHKTF